LETDSNIVLPVFDKWATRVAK